MSWFGRKKDSTPPAVDPKPDEIVQTIQKDFERKLSAMAITLEEMSVENTTLHKTLKEKDEADKAKRSQLSALEADLQVEREMTKEYQRRLEAMTRVLEEVVLQNANGPTAQPVAAKQFAAPFENEAFVSAEQINQAKKAREATPPTSPLNSTDDEGGKSSAAAKPSGPSEGTESPAQTTKRGGAASRKKAQAEDIPDDQPVDMPTISIAVPANLEDIQFSGEESANLSQTAKRYKAENGELKKVPLAMRGVYDRCAKLDCRNCSKCSRRIRLWAMRSENTKPNCPELTRPSAKTYSRSPDEGRMPNTSHRY